MWSPHFVRAALTVLHGTQALAGYMLMLCAMTFSAEFLVVTVVGLSLGYTVFFHSNPNDADAFLEDNTHVNANPCCNFMEDEAKEHPQEDVAIRNSRLLPDRFATTSSTATDENEPLHE